MYFFIKYFNYIIIIYYKKETYLDGNKFKLAVQSQFLNNKSYFIANPFIINDYEIKYCYDCLCCISDISKSLKEKKSKMFHFLQINHFAFDSMLYDPIAKVLILFQITINKNHDIHYEEIVKFIKHEPIQIKTFENTKERRKLYDKYYHFFEEIIKKDYVQTCVFQWLINERYTEIEKSKEVFNKKEKEHKLSIYCYHQELLDEIMKCKH